MARFKFALILISACIASAPAAASVVVLGSSSARLCYQAAESDLPPERRDMDDCNRALAEEGLSDRDTVATHVNRGILRSRGGDIAGALADFDRASSLDPNEPEAYLNKALVLTMKTKQASQALPLFTAAIEKKTTRPALAYFGRATANEDLGNIQSAYFDYSRAVTEDPKWDAPRVELARFNVRRR